MWLKIEHPEIELASDYSSGEVLLPSIQDITPKWSKENNEKPLSDS